MRCESHIELAGPPEAPPERGFPPLRLADRGGSCSRLGLLASGAEIPCDLRVIEHPEGRFTHEDGTRYDICLMEVQTHPNLRAPAVARVNFVGDRADNQPAVIRLGNVRQSSFRLCLIAPGEALGTLAVAAKSNAAVEVWGDSSEHGCGPALSLSDWPATARIRD